MKNFSQKFLTGAALISIGLSGLVAQPLAAQRNSTSGSEQRTDNQDQTGRDSVQNKDQAPNAGPKSLQQKYSYLFGYNLVKDLQVNEIPFDLKALMRGIQEATDGKQPSMTDEEIQSVQVALQKMVQRKQQERLARLADTNKREGAEFLKANRLKDGVKELENGLQYQILVPGGGASPRLTDTVKLKYKAMLVDGTVWEQTPGNEPVTLAVGSAGMRAIVTALQKMKPGEKWKLFIPSELAFGVQGQPPVVGPNQVLIYELELVEVVK